MFAIRRYTATGAIDAGARLYRSELGTLLSIGLAVAVPNAVLGALAAALQHASSAQTPGAGGGSLGVQGLLVLGYCGFSLLVVVGTLVLGTIATAASTLVISASALGRKMGFAEAVRAALPMIGTLIGASILTGLVQSAGFLFCLIPGLVAMVGLSFVGPVVVLERAGPTEALQRSWNLAKGRLLKLFGAYVLVGIVFFVVALAPAIAVTLLFPDSLTGAIGSSVIQQLSGALVQPLIYGTVVALYYDARVEKEAFDVEMLAAQVAVPGAPRPPTPADGAAPPR